MTTLVPCPNYIGGEWRTPSGVATSPVYNPSTGDVIAEAPMGAAKHVDAAVNAAQAAFPAWRDTPPVERARVFFRYRQIVEQNFERLCQTISREHGKTHAEARGSVFRGIENIEYACGVPALLMGDTLENLARGVDCETLHQPLGVCAGITPFNFPAMVPLWMFPLALACGNTFVLKPSEKVPLERGSARRTARTGRTAQGRVQHRPWRPRMRGCPARSSQGPGRFIRRLHARSRNTSTKPAPGHGKRVQANGGAKNYIVIMPDADMNKTVESARHRRVRLRRRALHGRLHRPPGGRRPPSACCRRSSKPRAPSRSAPPTARPSPTWARSSPRSIATAS